MTQRGVAHCLQFWERSRAPRPATGKQRMPNREMNKIESRYDLYQWLKVARAIKKLKADIGLGIGALQERIAMNGEVSELIYQLKEQAEDLNALTLQMQYMDADMDKALNSAGYYLARSERNP